ncbi:DUF1572 family protein [Priestia megaterium]|uniref:DUF1572 family protein n=1 Tax=Priestia megaterium TaxID=1404 RepID=UPI0026E1A126|nr:DUF1572 family protein [Priestia megaterium]MDO6847898.1 DUF1572 family protein [Priestia megaterium]
MNCFIKESIESLDTQLNIIQTCISRLEDNDIWKKFRQETNSIGNLCLHLAGSEYAFISSIIGGKPFIRQRSKEFTDNRVMNSDQLIENLILTRQRSKEVVGNFDFNDLKSNDRLIRIFCILERRVGKRTLRKMKEFVSEENILVQDFYKLRCDAENIHSSE